jgi:chaperone modulatory protein CbpM
MTRPNTADVPVVEDELELSLDELSRSCRCSSQWLIALVHEGVLEPRGEAPEAWRFAGPSLRRARAATRLMQDLEVNAAGAALALDLMDDIRALRHQLRFGPAAS